MFLNFFVKSKKTIFFHSKDSRSNIGKYIELLKIIAEFAEDHVNYQLINKDRHSGDDETHEKWNNVMTQSYDKLDHAKRNRHDAKLNNRLLAEEFLKDPKKMKELDEFHKSMKKEEKKTVPKKKENSHEKEIKDAKRKRQRNTVNKQRSLKFSGLSGIYNSFLG